jgi:hypothetical protein
MGGSEDTPWLALRRQIGRSGFLDLLGLGMRPLRREGVDEID